MAVLTLQAVFELTANAHSHVAHAYGDAIKIFAHKQRITGRGWNCHRGTQIVSDATSAGVNCAQYSRGLVQNMHDRVRVNLAAAGTVTTVITSHYVFEHRTHPPGKCTERRVPLFARHQTQLMREAGTTHTCEWQSKFLAAADVPAATVNVTIRQECYKRGCGTEHINTAACTHAAGKDRMRGPAVWPP
eukprot:186659-Chlamydomonas_euryale.AAC.2